MNRREILFAPALLVSCSASSRSDGALSARPATRVKAATAGLHKLGLRAKRDALLFVPKAPSNKLVLYLHGAGGSEEQGPNRFGALAEKLGVMLLSPASEGRTWDAIRSGFGLDIAMIDHALRKAFEMANVEQAIVAGFSDGASYALGIGLRNPDLFAAVAAFSPGFIAGGSGDQKRKTRVFVSHGTADEILPIDSCSRQLVPRLQRDGHAVQYREFDGPHTVPPAIAEEGLRWAFRL